MKNAIAPPAISLPGLIEPPSGAPRHLPPVGQENGKKTDEAEASLTLFCGHEA